MSNLLRGIQLNLSYMCVTAILMVAKDGNLENKCSYTTREMHTYINKCLYSNTVVLPAYTTAGIDVDPTLRFIQFLNRNLLCCGNAHLHSPKMLTCKSVCDEPALSEILLGV